MKKLLILSATSLFIVVQSYSQSAKDVFSASEITWYGLDYSKARFISSAAFTNPYDIRSRFFDSWNGLVMNEAEKYDVRGAFYKDKVNYNLDMINKRNQEKTKADEIVINKSYSFPEAEVQKVVSEYTPEEKSGIGVVFIVESYDKPSEMAYVWVTAFDIATKKVLITEKMAGKAQGIGIRNYWAYTTFQILKQLKSSEYSNWKTKYSK